eukprot:1144451-Pelagomonas_calceolata.AAC.8
MMFCFSTASVPELVNLLSTSHLTESFSASHQCSPALKFNNLTKACLSACAPLVLGVDNEVPVPPKPSACRQMRATAAAEPRRWAYDRDMLIHKRVTCGIKPFFLYYIPMVSPWETCLKNVVRQVSQTMILGLCTMVMACKRKGYRT